MTVDEQAAQFDVNGPGIHGKLFGLPFTPDTAKLIVIAIPWEATACYRSGTVSAPESILKASQQIDFFLREIPDAWKMGISMLPFSLEIKNESNRVRTLVGHCRTVHNDEGFVILAKI